MSHLTTKFSRKASILRSEQALSDDQMRAVAPSVFAESKHASRSDKYEFIPTSQVLAGLRREGFQPFMVAQGATRIEGKAEFTKHMIRLRHEGQGKVQGQANEIILINSHDGASSYQMLAGMFRFVCCNGLVVGQTAHDLRIPHKGNVQHDVIEGAYRVLDDFQAVGESTQAMKALALDPKQRYWDVKALQKDLKGWGDGQAMGVVLTEYATKTGIKTATLETLTDPAMVVALDKARRYDELQASKTAIKAKAQANIQALAK